MTYLIFILIGFIAGVLCAGYVVAAIGGVKTDLALMRANASNDLIRLHNRIADLEQKIASKLP